MITRGCAVVSIRGNGILGSDVAMVFFFVVSVQYVSLNTSGQYYIHRFQEEHVNTHKSSSRKAPPPSHQLSDFVLKYKYQSWCKNNALFKLLLLTLKFVLNYRDTLHFRICRRFEYLSTAIWVEYCTSFSTKSREYGWYPVVARRLSFPLDSWQYWNVLHKLRIAVSLLEKAHLPPSSILYQNAGPFS